MSRTNSTNVRGVLLANYNASYDLSAFIETASALVDDVVECATEKGVTISDARLELIERWLAAAYYLDADLRYKSKSTGRASASFYESDYYLNAKRLDPSGCLEGILESVHLDAVWLGKTDADKLTYDERNPT